MHMSSSQNCEANGYGHDLDSLIILHELHVSHHTRNGRGEKSERASNTRLRYSFRILPVLEWLFQKCRHARSRELSSIWICVFQCTCLKAVGSMQVGLAQLLPHVGRLLTLLLLCEPSFPALAPLQNWCKCRHQKFKFWKLFGMTG